MFAFGFVVIAGGKNMTTQANTVQVAWEGGKVVGRGG